MGLTYPPTGRLSEICEKVLSEMEEEGRSHPENLQRVVGAIVSEGLRNSIFIDVLRTRDGLEVRQARVH